MTLRLLYMLHLLLLVLILTMPAIHFAYPCVDTCSRGSHSQRGLSIHQATCKHYKQAQVSHLETLALEFEAIEEPLQHNASQHLETSTQLLGIANHPSNHSVSSLYNLSLFCLHFLLFLQINLDIEDILMPHDDLTAPSPPAEPVMIPTTGRGQRKKRPTWKVLEQQKLLQAHTVTLPTTSSPSIPPAPIFDPIFETHQTNPDQFSLYAEYDTPTLFSSTDSQAAVERPTPVNFIEPIFSVPPKLAQQGGAGVSDPTLQEKLKACSNESSALMMQWFWRTSTKSLEDFDYFAHEIFPRLKPAELANFSARKETALIDAALDKDSDRWQESSVTIQVPDGRPHRSPSDSPIPLFSVPGLQHRSIVETIRSVWSSPESRNFQYVPFRHFWTNTPSNKHERIYGELYTSDAFIEAHDALQRQPPESGCTLERVVCALMAYSDSTHLANFGDASLWPLYIYFGNQSKYIRIQPSSGSCHHIAYIPKVGFYANQCRPPLIKLITHLTFRCLIRSMISILISLAKVPQQTCSLIVVVSLCMESFEPSLMMSLSKRIPMVLLFVVLMESLVVFSLAFLPILLITQKSKLVFDKV